MKWEAVRAVAPFGFGQGKNHLRFIGRPIASIVSRIQWSFEIFGVNEAFHNGHRIRIEKIIRVQEAH